MLENFVKHIVIWLLPRCKTFFFVSTSNFKAFKPCYKIKKAYMSQQFLISKILLLNIKHYYLFSILIYLTKLKTLKTFFFVYFIILQNRLHCILVKLLKR